MKLNRRQALIGGSASLALPWVRPSYAQAQRVNVYNWSDYIGETTVEDFASETGIEIVYDLYASAEEMQAKMLAGSSGYDVVLQTGLGLHRLVAAGVFQKIDQTKLTGWETLDPAILKVVQGFDPGHAHGVPYTWGTVGFTFNMTMVKERLPGVDLNSPGRGVPAGKRRQAGRLRDLASGQPDRHRLHGAALAGAGCRYGGPGGICQDGRGLCADPRSGGDL